MSISRVVSWAATMFVVATLASEAVSYIGSQVSQRADALAHAALAAGGSP